MKRFQLFSGKLLFIISKPNFTWNCKGWIFIKRTDWKTFPKAHDKLYGSFVEQSKEVKIGGICESFQILLLRVFLCKRTFNFQEFAIQVKKDSKFIEKVKYFYQKDCLSLQKIYSRI